MKLSASPMKAIWACASMLADAGPPTRGYRITIEQQITIGNNANMPDANEPNDTRKTATPISVGAPVTGYFFSGYQSATVKLPWDDWFKVTLPDGMAVFHLSDLPDGAHGNVELQDSVGVNVATAGSPADVVVLGDQRYLSMSAGQVSSWSIA